MLMYTVYTINDMNPEQKQTRLKELSREKFLSDDEQAEKDMLTEELEIIHNEETQPIIEPVKVKREKRSIAQILIEKLKPKQEAKATWDEIQQLKLEYAKARLIQGIAKAKADTPAKKSGMAKFMSVLSSTSGTEQKTKKGKSKKSKQSSVDDFDIRKLLGKDDPHKYDGLFKK